MKNIRCLIAASVVALCLSITAADASVVVGATRVVFQEQEHEATIRLTNEGDVPALVETWVDSGNRESSPDKADSPFTLSPPIFRIEPHRGQTIRMIYSQDPLPQDKESVFWLNVLEIPPMPKMAEGESKNMLQFAFRSRLKVFFRPKNLPGNPLKASEQVTWKLIHGESDQGCLLQVINPTPYHITFTEIDTSIGAQKFTSDGGMVDPQGPLTFQLKGLQKCPAVSADIVYTTINDYGGAVSYKGTATHE